jgi:hypothetical protein
MIPKMTAKIYSPFPSVQLFMGVYSPGLEIAGYLDFDFKCLN